MALIWLIFCTNRFKMLLKFFFFQTKLDHKCSSHEAFSLDELVKYALPNLLFQKNHSHNSSMFCHLFFSWKELAWLSKMSILEKLESQTGQSCDLLFEWTDLRCFYISLFWEKAWSQIEIFFNLFLYELIQYALPNRLFQNVLFTIFFYVLWHPDIMKMIGMSFQNVYSRKT